MTTSVSCPCSTAITDVTACEASAEEAIFAHEHAAFQALASGAQFYVRWHDTGHTPSEAATELNGILRRLRITLALLETQVAKTPPTQQMPGPLAGDVRSWAHIYGRIAAHLYREAARLDAATLGDHQPAVPRRSREVICGDR
ncbi:hypothetical protein [Amycolatopsis sp. NPDC051371]|uniref:hypothetical protein n=1 Tax=Amycolatopsis sp. NPDC051371 TaxID=3155800 RepID=UPI0034467C34